MTPMMSAIFFEAVDLAHGLTAWPTTAPPFSACVARGVASWLAWPALSAFCFTVEVISSMVEAVSSRLEACSSVR